MWHVGDQGLAAQGTGSNPFVDGFRDETRPCAVSARRQCWAIVKREARQRMVVFRPKGAANGFEPVPDSRSQNATDEPYKPRNHGVFKLVGAQGKIICGKSTSATTISSIMDDTSKMDFDRVPGFELIAILLSCVNNRYKSSAKSRPSASDPKFVPGLCRSSLSRSAVKLLEYALHVLRRSTTNLDTESSTVSRIEFRTRGTSGQQSDPH